MGTNAESYSLCREWETLKQSVLDGIAHEIATLSLGNSVEEEAEKM